MYKSFSFQDPAFIKNIIAPVATAAYITEVDTQIAGASASDTFQLSTAGSGYNFQINWGDGVIETYTGSPGVIPHVYPAPGIYEIQITGDFPYTRSYDGGDELKITTIKQWGDIQWSSFGESYFGCNNLVITALDAPNLTNVTDMNFAFFNCGNPNFSTAHDFTAWDVSNVIGMLATFANTQFNEPIGSWDMNGVTITNAMFNNAPFNQDISGWDMSTNGDAQNMFAGNTAFNQDISGWNMSSMFNTISMFQGASSFDQDISGWNVSAVGVMNSMFAGASAFNQDLGTWNITSLNEAYGSPLIQVFQNSGMSLENYSRTLIGWANTVFANGNLPININMTEQNGMEYDNTILTVGGQFNDAVSARNYLTTTCGWLISDDVDVSPYIIEVDTSISGVTASNTFRLPTTGSGYDFVVDWGDGTEQGYTGSPGNIDHVYASGGVKEIKITGTFPRIFFNNAGDRAKLTKIKQWGAIQWTSFDAAYRGCTNLQITALDAPNLSGVSVTRQAFTGCSNLNFSTAHNFNVWNTSAVSNMIAMFQGATNFNQPIGNWNTSGVTQMSSMFSGASSFNQPIGDWDVSNVIVMPSMFSGASSFNQPIGAWNTVKVINMSSMFLNATAFNQPIGGWNTAAVTNMALMFSGASAFDRNIGTWNTGAVTSMDRMFNFATAFNNGGNSSISNWNVQNVTNMNQLFEQASVFNQPLANWRTDSVTNMTGMFASTSAFNQPINRVSVSGVVYWDTSNVTAMGSMFSSATAFNQNIGAWDVLNVTNMSLMFDNASAFNNGTSTSIGNWLTNNVTNMTRMFRNATVFNRNISGWCVQLIPTQPTDFKTGSALTNPNTPVWGAPC